MPKKGTQKTEEHKKKLSEARKKYYVQFGNKHGFQKGYRSPRPFKKGHIPWNKGKKGLIKHGEESKNKARQRMLGSKNPNFGKRPKNWRGGLRSVIRRLRDSDEYKLWCKAVFERDNWTCVWCLKRGGNLEADHIKPFAYFPEFRFAIDNGRTLCKNCHQKTDTYTWRAQKLYKNQKD